MMLQKPYIKSPEILSKQSNKVGEIMTMCFEHNRYFRIGKCPKCIEEVEAEALRVLEEEKKNKKKPIILWEYKGK